MTAPLGIADHRGAHDSFDRLDGRKSHDRIGDDPQVQLQAGRRSG